MLTIRVRRQDGGDEQTREFQEESITIGRHPDSHLVLAESTVSRKHARIELKDGRYHITDLGSAHGLYINKERVTDQPLPESCEIYVNPFVLHVTAAAPAATEATAPPPDGGPAAAPPDDEALQTLPAGDNPAPGVPIELDIEDERGAELPLLGEHEDEGIIPLDADDGADGADESAVLELGDVPGTIADSSDADPAPEPEPEPEPEPDNSPDTAPENIVGTIFELNAGPPKAAPSSPDARPTAELSPPPDPPSTEFKSSIDVDDEPAKSSDASPSSEMVMAPATAITPAGQQPQGIDEGTVLEYSAKDVHAYAEAVEAEAAHAAAAAAAAAGDSGDGGDSGADADDDALGTLPRHGGGHSDGSVPRTRAHMVGPAAGPAAKATPELQWRAAELVAGREHGRLVALLLGIALVAMTLLGTRGAPVPAFMGGSGVDPFVWLAALFGGVAAIIGARLIPNALWRGVTIAAGGVTPLGALLATFDTRQVVGWIDAKELSEGVTTLKGHPGPALLFGWGSTNPLALWMLAVGAVLLLAAARIARTWPESRCPRVLGPVAGVLCLCVGLLPASSAGGMAYAALFAEGASTSGYLLLSIPLAGVFGLALAAGKGRVLTFVPAVLLAIGFCSTALLHVAQRVNPEMIDQARLTLLPVPMVFLAATGIAAAVIAELTRRRPDAQELLDRL